MGFWDIFRKKSAEEAAQIAESRELFDATLQFQARELAFWSCVNLIANAMGRCEVKTFQNGKPFKGAEYYMWNIEPNKNQSSSAFWHKLVAMCYKHGAALIVSEPYGSGVVVADDWTLDDSRTVNEYKNVRIVTRTIERLPEREVLHIRPNDKFMEPIIAGLNQSFLNMLSAAMQSYQFNAGQHWKVHVDHLTKADPEWLDTFQQMVNKQIKPFFNSQNGILPEFNGFEYEQISGGSKTKAESGEVRDIIEDIFNETARGFLIPAVLVNGKVEQTADANTRFLTNVIDPLADQIEEAINRGRYGYDEWRRGNYVHIDTSSIVHFDMFANAPNVEKLIGSGAWSVNEIRREAGYAPIPEDWADKHFLTLNISTMQAAVDGTRKGVKNE